MLIRDIYLKYEIMPQLETHMLRVAGVGKIILGGWKSTIDRDLVMKTLLLHDMGNIVKFDLVSQIIPIENIEYWRKVQAEWWDRYGKDAHNVTKHIVAELGQNEVNKIMDNEHAGYVGDDPAKLLEQDWPEKILSYCDVRVTPSGVVPMPVRIADLQKRYGRELSWYDFLYKLEEQLKPQTTVDLNSVTEERVSSLFDELLTYTV